LHLFWLLFWIQRILVGLSFGWIKLGKHVQFSIFDCVLLITDKGLLNMCNLCNIFRC
jgi:hypothetical protein